MTRRNVIFLAAAPLANVISPALLAGIPSKKAVYRGGTLAAPTPSTKGEVCVTEPAEFIFDYRAGQLRVPYDRINVVEYGQKTGRRLGLAVVLSPAFLLSRKRKHYLTINYLDTDGGQQAAVFELGKKIVRTTLAGLEARTGLRIEYQDEQARKASKR
jgi:hypothetical protein